MNRKPITKNIDILILGLHFLLLILYISPFNYLKPIQGLLLYYGGMYLISGLLIGFIIFYLTKKRLGRAIILLILSIGLIQLDLQAYQIRQDVLNKTINWFYCPPNDLVYGDKILGGVFFIGSKSEFENNTHCFLTVCHEEHYFCHN